MSISDDTLRNGENAADEPRNDQTPHKQTADTPDAAPQSTTDTDKAASAREGTTVESTADNATATLPTVEGLQASKKRRRATVAVVVAAVIVVAAVGMFVWHEQPSFCSAICHTPMDSYLPTYEASIDGSGTDKWGNTVEDASSMLAPVHATAGKTCMDCHVPTLSEQLTEGAEWITGNYASPLGERTLDQLAAARGLENSEEFCMNDTCHNFSREDLEKKTAWMGEINPHSPQHGEQDCGLCHKAHRESVMYCSQCHTEAVVPDGWVSYQESEDLLAQSGTTEQ